MSEPTSPADIANLSLDHLGAAAVVTNLETPVSTPEKVAARHYDVVRRALLRLNVWNFALNQTTVTKNNTSAMLGYSDAYTLPNDFIRFVGIQNDDDYTFKTIKSRRAGNSILINADGASSVQLVYVSDVKDVVRMDPSFIDAFALGLAVAMAFQITKDEKIRDAVNKLYTLALQEAISADGQENPPERYERSQIIEARKGIGDSYDYTHYDLP